MTRICITGVTLTGNKGGTSMLYAVLDALRPAIPGCTFDLLSVYPENDRKANREPDLCIIAVPPWLLVGVLFPLSLLAWPLARFPGGRAVLSVVPAFRSLLSAAAVVDLSGIAFVDGRGLPVMLYNAAVCLPAILLNGQVVKLSQALGPFRQSLNRWLAGRVLPRCAAVVGRGEQTRRHLEDLGMKRPIALPDVSFAMRLTDAASSEAGAIITRALSRGPRLVLVPSAVVAGCCARMEIDYAAEMAAFVGGCLRAGVSVAILPYSTVARGRRNNDLVVCRRIIERMGRNAGGILLDGDYDARTLRAMIGAVDFAVVCRFHAMIAALATATPLLVVGWGHKYREVLEDFSLTDWCLDWQSCREARLAERFDSLRRSADEIRLRIQRALPWVTERAGRNFDLVMQATSQAVAPHQDPPSGHGR